MQYVKWCLVYLKCKPENISSPLHHFVPPCFCSTVLFVFTGMVISEDWMAGLGSGASTVRTPSGESEEVIFSASAPGGSLEKTRRQPAYVSGSRFNLRFYRTRSQCKEMVLLCALCELNQKLVNHGHMMFFRCC